VDAMHRIWLEGMAGVLLARCLGCVAMDVASGVTVRTCCRRHRHQEFLRFLNEIEDHVPARLDVHVVMDHYGTHKVAKVRSWSARPFGPAQQESQALRMDRGCGFYSRQG